MSRRGPIAKAVIHRMKDKRRISYEEAAQAYGALSLDEKTAACIKEEQHQARCRSRLPVPADQTTGGR